MLNVLLVSVLNTGDKLYWKGGIYDIVHTSDSRYDLVIKHTNKHGDKLMYWLDKVYITRNDYTEHYYRVCNSRGEYVDKIEKYQFNIVVTQ